MRLLLDENMDRKLARFFGDQHDVLTVKQRGWVGVENGDLITAAQEEFDALVWIEESRTGKTSGRWTSLSWCSKPRATASRT